MRIGVDIDEVVADSVPSYLPVLSEVVGRPLKKEDLVRYEFEETFGLSEAEMKRFWRAFDSSGGWERIRPVPDAASVLGRLRRVGEVILVTGRPEAFVGAQTRRWLAAHAIPHDALVFMGEADKDEAVRRALGGGLDVLIEDHWGFAERVAGRGTPVFLVDAPWNRTAPPHPLVRRVAGLAEAAGEILAGRVPAAA